MNKCLEVIWKFRLELWAEGNKLRAEGNKLRAEGDKLWADGILQVYSNIKLEWVYVLEKEDYECKLENGEIYSP